MKNYIQELAEMGTTDVTAVTPKIISAVMEEIRRDSRIWAQFYKPNRDLINGGGREISFPKKKTGITATFDVAPGEGLTASDMSYDAVTIPVKKGGVALGFQGEAIRQAMRDVLADAIKEAGEVWSDTLDLVAFEAMFPSASTIISGANTVALSFPVIGLESVADSTKATITNQATASSVITTAANTITYWYVPTTGVLSSDTVAVRRVTESAGTFTAKDLLRGRADMIAKKYRPDVVIMHPTALTDILYDTTVKFLERSAYAAQTPTELYNGELGKIWDMKVIVTNKMPRYGIAMLSSKDIGYEVWRKPLKLVRDEYTGMSADVLYFWGFSELNYGVVNPHAYGAVALQGTLTETDSFEA